MSKFKSFASQGSFRDNQLQAPDKTQKIKQETATTVRGLERAQSFLQENNRIYLQAQKQAQSQEEAQREQNFRLETENRKAFRDALDRDYEIQTENDRKQAAAQQKTFKELSAFSKTAFDLYNTVDQKITENQTKANAAKVYAAGADYETVVNIQNLSDNLTKAELAQQDFIRQKIAEGGNLDAYYALYESRKTRGFINNIAVAQNTAYSVLGASNKFLEDYNTENPNATVEQRQKAYKTFINTFVGNFSQLNPDLLNNTVYPIIRRIENQFNGEFERDLTKQRDEKRNDDTFKTFNVAWETKGAAGIIEALLTNPSAEKFALSAKWVANRSADTGPNGLSDEDVYSILDFQISGPNGEPTTLRKQRAGRNDVTAMLEAAKSYRRAKIGETKLKEDELKLQVIAGSTEIYNRVAADGDLTAQDVAEIEEYERSIGIPGFESNVLKAAREQQDSVRYDAAAKELLDKQLATGNLTVERVMSMKGISAQLKQTYLNAAKAQENAKQSPVYKSDVEAIKAVISQDPRVKAAPVTGAKNYSVILMQERFVRQYKETLARTGSNDEARSVTLAAIQTLQSNPNAVNTEGNYTEIVQQEAQFAKKGEQALQEYQEFLKAASEPDFRTNSKKAVNSIGAANFYNSYDQIKAGKEPTAIIKNGAALMGVSPLEFINYLADGAGQPPITVDDQIQQIKDSMKPITRRLYNVNRTNERVNRANMTNAGLMSEAPTRFNPAPGVGDRTLNSFAPQVSSIVMENDSGQPGMDIFFEDKKFPAVLPGVVKEVGWQGNQQAGYGNYLVVESIDPATGEKVDVLYAHLAMPSHFSEGTSILPGMVIGTQGGTGSVRSVDGTIASIDFLAPAPKGSGSMVPYRNFKQLRQQIATQLSQ